MRKVKEALPSVIGRLDANPAFRDIQRMLDAYCDRWVIVGGRIYRTLAEEVHGEKCGADTADWDFLCWNVKNPKIEFDGWVKMRGQGRVTKYDDEGDMNYSFRRPLSSENKRLIQQTQEWRKLSARFAGGRYGQKVDFVAADDIKTGPTLKDYFDVVPLDIQAVSLDWQTKRLEGDQGIAAVCRKRLILKNPVCLSSEGRNPDDYLIAKQDSMRPMKFEAKHHILGQKHDCYCFPDDMFSLMSYGCRCGGK
jgi:hypothetical protein